MPKGRLRPAISDTVMPWNDKPCQRNTLGISNGVIGEVALVVRSVHAVRMSRQRLPFKICGSNHLDLPSTCVVACWMRLVVDVSLCILRLLRDAVMAEVRLLEQDCGSNRRVLPLG